MNIQCAFYLLAKTKATFADDKKLDAEHRVANVDFVLLSSSADTIHRF